MEFVASCSYVTGFQKITLITDAFQEADAFKKLTTFIFVSGSTGVCFHPDAWEGRVPRAKQTSKPQSHIFILYKTVCCYLPTPILLHKITLVNNAPIQGSEPVYVSEKLGKGQIRNK